MCPLRRTLLRGLAIQIWKIKQRNSTYKTDNKQKYYYLSGQLIYSGDQHIMSLGIIKLIWVCLFLTQQNKHLYYSVGCLVISQSQVIPQMLIILIFIIRSVYCGLMDIFGK